MTCDAGMSVYQNGLGESRKIPTVPGCLESIQARNGSVQSVGWGPEERWRKSMKSCSEFSCSIVEGKKLKTLQQLKFSVKDTLHLGLNKLG